MICLAAYELNQPARSSKGKYYKPVRTERRGSLRVAVNDPAGR